MTLESLIEADRLLTECKIAWGRVERVIDDDGEVYRPFGESEYVPTQSTPLLSETCLSSSQIP